jgi:transposase
MLGRRSRIERLSNKLKQFRRVATLCDKLTANSMASSSSLQSRYGANG